MPHDKSNTQLSMLYNKFTSFLRKIISLLKLSITAETTIHAYLMPVIFKMMHHSLMLIAEGQETSARASFMGMHALSLGLSRHAHKVDTITISRRVWQVVAKMRTIDRHAFTIGQDADVIPIDFIVPKAVRIQHYNIDEGSSRT